MSPELEEYIENHISPEPKYLSELERQSNLRLLNGRMCSGRLQGRLLKMLVEMISPQRVLELGTFAGYSALCMAEGLSEDGIIDTIEVDDELEDFIRNAFSSSPYGNRIRLHIGAAMDILTQFPKATFDLAFIDADKREYTANYLAVKPLIKPGGWIIADNTLWDGHVIESTKHSSQTQGIIDFNDYIANDPDAEVVILPLRDGLTIIHITPH